MAERLPNLIFGAIYRSKSAGSIINTLCHSQKL